MTCGGQTFVDNPMGTCRHSEYGDIFDPMGGGCRHMNAWQKSYQGWYGACNGVKVGKSGTFTLLSNGRACDGAQFLQIPAPKVRMMPRSGGGGQASVDMLSHYYVEFRAPDNFDGTLGWRNMPQAALTPQVHVRVGGDLKSRTQRGLHTWLLDMNPMTTSDSDAALAVDKTFTDPAGGLSLTVMAADANSATIKVDLPGGAGMNTCIDGTPFQAPGPGPESCGAIMVNGDGGLPPSIDGGPGAGGGDAGVDMPGAGGTGGGGMIGGNGGALADAGQSGTGGAAVIDGGTMTGPSPVDASTVGVNSNSIVGCGCRTGGETAPVSLGTLALATGLALARRRKRH
jgi:MYXO-CTERM domain-containing protein